jgi:hypothetical protein
MKIVFIASEGWARTSALFCRNIDIFLNHTASSWGRSVSQYMGHYRELVKLRIFQ